MKKLLTVLTYLFVNYFLSAGFSGNIVYPWRATTAIVKSGESFEVWFNANAGQTVNSIVLKGPYLPINVSIVNIESHSWVYDQWSGNTFNQKITVSVPEEAPADRYDLILKTSEGDEISLAAVKVIKEYKDSYYILHISDPHRWQGAYDTPNIILREISTIIDIANIIDPELMVETGDGHYPNTNNMTVTGERIEQYLDGFLLNGTTPVNGLNDAYAPVFMVPGNHDTPMKNYKLEPDLKTPASYWNTYYGLQSYSFSYGETRFIGVNNSWFPDSKGTPNYTHQVDDAIQWLSEVGAGNFRVGLCHVPQESIPSFYDPLKNAGMPLDLMLCGHVHSTTHSPYTIDNRAIVYTTRTCRDGNARAPFNLYKVDAITGSYEPVGSINGAHQGLETAKDYTSCKLTLSYRALNDGNFSDNAAKIVNKFDFPVSGARIRFVMPKGSPYYVTKGRITQEFDGTDHHIVDVAIDLEANSTRTVEIKAGIKPDLCPDDPDKDEPGYCGCGVPEGTCHIYANVVAIEPVKTKINLNVRRQFTATVSPANASDKTIIWSTGNPDVATVSSTGIVTAVSEGTVTITATAKDGAMSAASEVKVLPDYINYQAEDAEFDGPEIVTNHPDYNGTGFLDYSNPSGDYIKWSVYVPSTGTYPLSFRYALEKGDRPLELMINDEVRIASLLFPATGSFETWKVYTTDQLLSAGTNTIMLTAIGSSGGNFDELIVGDDDVGINDLKSMDNERSFTIYPTPFHNGTLHIDFVGFQNYEDVCVKLFDFNGRLLYQQNNCDTKHEELVLSEKLSESVYFISVQSDEWRSVKKLIVSNK